MQSAPVYSYRNMYTCYNRVLAQRQSSSERQRLKSDIHLSLSV